MNLNARIRNTVQFCWTIWLTSCLNLVVEIGVLRIWVETLEYIQIISCFLLKPNAIEQTSDQSDWSEIGTWSERLRPIPPLSKIGIFRWLCGLLSVPYVSPYTPTSGLLQSPSRAVIKSYTVTAIEASFQLVACNHPRTMCFRSRDFLKLWGSYLCIVSCPLIGLGKVSITLVIGLLKTMMLHVKLRAVDDNWTMTISVRSELWRVKFKFTHALWR